MPRKRVRGPRVAAALLTLVLAVVACGNRLPHEEVVAGARGAAAGVGGGAAVGGGAGVGGGGGTSPGGATGAGGGPVEPGGGTQQPGAATGPTGAGGASTGPGQGGSAQATKSPIVIGTVGNYSGVAGSVHVPGLRAMQAWVGTVNAKGGIGGHPIKYIVADDQADPTRHRAALQDLVERQGVIAIVGMFAALTEQAGRDYIERKRVPVVGGISVSLMWHSSPMYFAHSSKALDNLFGQFRTAARLGGGKKALATLTCVEGETCSEFKRGAQQLAAPAGLRLVYQADISLAQPDFTAECINAQQRGAEIIMPVGDPNTLNRVATSCLRQGFRPLFINLTPAEKQTEFEPLDGSVAAQGFFPFVGVKGTATDEYLRAMRTYAPNQELGTLSPGGWTAGRLFEKVLTIALQRTDRPKSNDILEALWTIRNESLGGLLLPVTYTKNRAARVPACWFTMQLKGRRWLTPDGLRTSCRT